MAVCPSRPPCAATIADPVSASNVGKRTMTGHPAGKIGCHAESPNDRERLSPSKIAVPVSVCE